MNTFIEIPTPFPSLKTVKFEGSEMFRPSATGTDDDQIRLKSQMEALEIKASVGREPGFVATAAHYEEDAAVKNAVFEADERIAVAAWWAFNRESLGKISKETEEQLRETYEVGSDFGVTVGFVLPFEHDGYATVSILENKQQYPYIVLGAAFDNDYETAVHKAFIESVQSWTASAWEKQYAHRLGLWDIAELQKRVQAIDAAPVADPEVTFTAQDHRDHLRLETEQFEGAYVAWAYGDRFVSGRSSSLAQLALRDSDQFKVFTDHNQ